MWFAARRSETRDLGRWGALAFGLGYALGHGASLGGLPALPPTTSNEALFYGGLIAALAAAVAGSFAHRRIAWVVVGLGHVAAFWLVLRNLMAAMPPGELIAFCVLGFAVPAAVAVSVDSFAERERGVVAPLIVWMTATTCAIAIALSGSAIYAQFGASCAAVLGAAAVTGVLVREASFSRGVLLAALPHTALLAMSASKFSELPPPAVLLITIAPLALLLVPASRLHRLSAPMRVLVPIAVVAVPLIVALVLCWNAHAERSTNSYY